MRLVVLGVFGAGLGAGCCPEPTSVESRSAEQRTNALPMESAGPADALSIAPPDRLLEEFTAKECLGIAHYLRHGLRAEDEYRADALMTYALDPEHAHYVYAICRMLFISAGDRDVRRPLLGDSVFVDQGEWPLDPIVLENGIPFVVTTGWNLVGAAEMPHQYALHCLLNYEWTEAPIEERTDEEIRAAAESLIRRRGLTGEAAEFIRRQAPASAVSD